jgi:hypothetical protein
VSVTGVIAAFTTGTYTLVRSSGEDTYVKGRRVAPATSTSSIVGCIQPVTGRDLQVLPEGMRADEARVLYSTSELRAEPPIDRVIIDGEVWEVFKCERWQGFGTTHYKAFVSRMTVGSAHAEAEPTLGALTSTAAGTVA